VIEPPEGGERLLAALRRHRVFLRPAHEPGRWRFHRLFAQAARRELAAGSPAVAVDLHRRLVGHAAHAGDGAPASPADALGGLLHDELLAAHAVELLMEGRLAPPPPDTLAALGGAPAVGRLAVALAELTVGDVETADLALDGVGPAGEPVLEDLWSVAALLRARHAGDLAGADAAAHRVAASDAGGGRSALAWVELGTLEYDAGRYAEAEEHLHLAASLAERASRPALTARAWAGLAQLAASAGRLREATRIAALVEDRPDLPPDAGVRAEIARTIVAFLRDDLAQAGFHVGRARCAAVASQDPVLWLTVLLWEVAVLEGQGEDDRAGDRLAEAFDLLARCPGRPRHGLALDLFRIRLLERAGRSDEAAQRLAALAQQPHPALDLLIARRRLRDDDPDGAIAALRARLDETGGPARPLGIWRLLSYAAAVDRLGDHEAAHAAIEQALALAEPDAMRRPFTDDGPRARPLLERHLQRPTQHGAFVAELLDRLADGRPAPEAPFAVPLTDRERIVLGHLPSAMTAAEIAAALSVSEATVRTHLRHIYEKLGVHGRRDAVRRARDVRLLAPPGA
jgi:LuxR family maltose regulon positive regulatory protein